MSGNLDIIYYQEILDSIPVMIFVLDGDLRVRYLNKTAAAVFGLDKAKFLDLRGGEVLHCLHRHDVPEGCGLGPFCKDCIIRSAVSNCLHGQSIARQRTQFVVAAGDTRKDFELLITANPMPGSDQALAILVIEDISEMTSLQDLIPICAKCKRIRGDQEYCTALRAISRTTLGRISRMAYARSA